MQDNTERAPLRTVKRAELLDNLGYGRFTHSLGLALPTRVAHIEHVAVSAIEIASTRHLQQDGIYDRHRDVLLSIVPIMGSIVASCDALVLVTHFLDQASENRASQCLAPRQ